MNTINIAFLLLAILIRTNSCEEQNNATKEDEYIPIFEINIRVVEEKLPQILTDLVMENEYVKSLEFQKVLSNLNVTMTEAFIRDVLKRQGFENLFEKSEVGLSTLVQLIISKIQNPKNSLKPIVELFGLDYIRFMEAYTYVDNDELYSLLKEITYNDTILIEACKIANISYTEITRLVQEELVNPITHKNFDDCLEIFGKPQVEELLNQTLFSLQTSTVRNNSLIRDIVTNFTNTVTSQAIWAIETNDGIISIKDTYYFWRDYKNYFEGYLQNIYNRNITRNITSMYIGPLKTYSLIQTADNNTLFKSHITKADNYNVIPKKCTFWRKVGEKLETVNAADYHMKGCFIYVRNFVFAVSLGSPFVCDGKLYGMLTEQRDKTLDFIIVSDEAVCDLDDIDVEDSEEDESGGSKMQLSTVCILVIVSTLFLYP